MDIVWTIIAIYWLFHKNYFIDPKSTMWFFCLRSKMRRSNVSFFPDDRREEGKKVTFDRRILRRKQKNNHSWLRVNKVFYEQSQYNILLTAEISYNKLKAGCEWTLPSILIKTLLKFNVLFDLMSLICLYRYSLCPWI